MGLPMAGHLRAAGHGVTVQDPEPQRIGLAREQGLEALAADKGIGDADVVFSSLPHDEALLAVARLIASHAKRDLVHVDTSTVSPSASAEAAAMLDAAGVQSLRCTVSGNNKMAEAARLTTMVSARAPSMTGCCRCYPRSAPTVSISATASRRG